MNIYFIVKYKILFNLFLKYSVKIIPMAKNFLYVIYKNIKISNNYGLINLYIIYFIIRWII